MGTEHTNKYNGWYDHTGYPNDYTYSHPWPYINWTISYPWTIDPLYTERKEMYDILLQILKKILKILNEDD